MSDSATPVDVTGGSPTTPKPPTVGAGEPRHFVRMVAIWLVLSAIAVVAFYFLVGPHVPPGTMSSTAEQNQFDFNILMVIALPVLIGVWVYLGYSMITWRASKSADPVVGAVARNHLGVQTGWIVVTSVIVVLLAGFGTVELIAHNGAGGGEGPNPVWTPTSAHILPVQVIGQQWAFTYRYPSFGGFESRQLVLPADSTIAFHVTSLDVIHSFWAYQLSVKADANPQVDNIAYTSTRGNGTFTVR